MRSKRQTGLSIKNDENYVEPVLATKNPYEDVDFYGGERIVFENIEAMLETPILEIIPEDNAIKEALKLKDAVIHTHPESEAAKGYKKLAAKLLGKKYTEQVEKEERRKGRFHKLLRIFGLE